MKQERHLKLIMHLLNNDSASAKKLADKFEVSQRTIQRDIDTLTLAGIPIIAEMGSKGGYSIMSDYKLDKQLLNDADIEHLMKGLSALDSAISNKEIAETLDKIGALCQGKKKSQNQSEVYDLNLGVLKESAHVATNMPVVEEAITRNQQISFKYTSAGNTITERTVEPLLLSYRWYAWYLFGYCIEKRGYRLFKVTRMREVANQGAPFQNGHENWREIYENNGDQDIRNYVDVKAECSNDIRVQLEDYFPNAEFHHKGEEHFTMRFSVPEHERHWFGLLLSFGSQIKVLEPESVVQRINGIANEISKNYQDAITKNH